MTKHDEKDETPIQFYIPGPGHRVQIPRPVNQPNWSYKNFSTAKPGKFEWTLVIFLLLFSSAFSIILLHEFSTWTPLWIIVGAFGGLSILLIWSFLHRQRNIDSTKDGETGSKKDKPRKLPKRRKDYK